MNRKYDEKNSVQTRLATCQAQGGQHLWVGVHELLDHAANQDKQNQGADTENDRATWGKPARHATVWWGFLDLTIHAAS
jgi:hypothetical protein